MRALKVKALLQERKQKRREILSPYIASECKTVKNIVWTLQRTLLERKDVHDHITYVQLQRMSMFQKDLLTQAKRVYNEMFRNEETSKFVIVDLENKHLDGRTGRITSYDSIAAGYRVRIDPKRSDSGKDFHNMLLKPETMKMTKTVPLQAYNNVPKLDVTTVSLPSNFIARHSDPHVEIEFVASVFQNMTAKYAYFDQHGEEAVVDFRRCLLNCDNDRAHKVHDMEVEAANFHALCFNLATNHLSRTEQPRKRLRSNRAMPNATRAKQIAAVWNAKYEYIRDSAKRDDNHLFTLPFRTSDGSLLHAADNLHEYFDIPDDKAVSEHTLIDAIGRNSIIITKSNADSLLPIEDIDDEVLDLSMKR